ncbi:hypothetical protein AB0M58_13905 [Streptomyces bobili]|uniref:hypothetical protein n=1 Tax=Streptomyces bobili TaxID=67280 RepID=UPI00343FF5ED
MSALAAPARVPAPRSSRRLKVIPEQAGPAPTRNAEHPLALGRDTRSRLSRAVEILTPTFLSDAMRLALVVLASRTPEATGVVEIRVRELGRWLGLSESYVSSVVLPGLRQAGAVRTGTIPGEFGEDRALRCEVVALWDARGVVGHPLALQRKEFATLQRLCEALFAPGWQHRDGTVTPPGLLGTRTGRGAATDRLALLRLTLEAAETGRVRLCGGSVSARRGRLAATVARLLGCSASGGERVLYRLETAGVVERVRLATKSGLPHRSRLVIPAVAAAHQARGKAIRSDATAGASGVARPCEEPQLSAVPEEQDGKNSDPDVAADLHTDHSSVVQVVVPPTVDCGFSGEAAFDTGALPERACLREDDPIDPLEDPRPPLDGASGGPLRGEQPSESAPSNRRTDRGKPTPATRRLQLAQGEKRQQRGRGPRPPKDLEVVLRPVSMLWDRLDRQGARDRVVAAARSELELLSQITGPLRAPRALAERLHWRLDEQEGPAHVNDPVGWLISRGLPRRPTCSDVRCDDGIRLDTRESCGTCDYLVADRRALRRRFVADVEAQLPGIGGAERQRAIEERMREETDRAAGRAALRRERLEKERAERQQLLEDRRAHAEQERLAAQAAAEAREADPCEGCGAADGDGLCGACGEKRAIEQVSRQAVTVASAACVDPTDADEVRTAATAAEDALRQSIQAAQEQLRQQAGTVEVSEHALALAGRLAAETTAAKLRSSALESLASTAAAELEAQAAYSTTMRSWRRYGTRACARQAAREAGEQARERVVRHLLALRTGVLQGTLSAEVLRASGGVTPYAVGAARARTALRGARSA